MRNTRKFAVCLILLLSFFVSTFGIVSLNPALTVWAEEQKTSTESNEGPSPEAEADSTADQGMSEVDEILNPEEKATPEAEGQDTAKTPALDENQQADSEDLDSSQDDANSDAKNTTPEDAKTGSEQAESSDDSESHAEQGLVDKESTEQEPANEDSSKQNSTEELTPADDNSASDSSTTENNNEPITEDAADKDSEALGKTAEEEQSLTSDKTEEEQDLTSGENEGAEAEDPEKNSSQEDPTTTSENENPAEEKENTDSEQTADEDTSKPLPEDENKNKVIIIVSKNKDKTDDWLKLDESKVNNEPSNQPVFADEDGNLYYFQSKSGTTEVNEAYTLIDEKIGNKEIYGYRTDEKGKIICDDEGNPIRYKYSFALSADNVPLYSVEPVDEQGNPLDNSVTDKPLYRKWNQKGSAARAYELDIYDENGNAEKLQLSYANRLEDKFVDGMDTKTEQTYYVGKGTNLDFTVQFTPDAGVPVEYTENLKGTAKVVITLEGVTDPDSVNLTALKFDRRNYEFKKTVTEDGVIRFELLDPMAVGAYGVANADLAITGLDGSLGDKVTLTVDTTRSLTFGGKTQDFTNTINREFVIAESKFKEPEVKFDKSSSNDPKQNPSEHYAGPVDKEGRIDQDYAETLVTELIMGQSNDEWFKKNGEKINNLLRADKAAAQELQDLTIEIDLPYDEASATYAQYDPSAFPDNLIWEEIRKDPQDPTSPVVKLQLRLQRENVEGREDLRFVEDKLMLGDKELENAAITYAVLRKGDEMVFIDKNGDSYKVNTEFYDELESSGWKLEQKGDKQQLVYFGSEENKNDAKAYDIVDGKIQRVIQQDGQDVTVYYNLKIEDNEAVFYDPSEANEEVKRFQKVNDKLISYNNSFVVGLGNVVNELQARKDEAGEVEVDEDGNTVYNSPEARPGLDVALAIAEGLYNIILEKENESFYGGTISNRQVYLRSEEKDGQIINREISDDNNEYMVGSDGQVYRKNENGEQGDLVEDLKAAFLVLDQYGNRKDFYAQYAKDAENKDTWTFLKNKAEAGTEPADACLQVENEWTNSFKTQQAGGLVFDSHHKIVGEFDWASLSQEEQATAKNERQLSIEGQDGNKYQIIFDKYYYDEAAKAFENITKEQDENGSVQAGRFYSDYKEVGKLVEVERQVVASDKEPEVDPGFWQAGHDKVLKEVHNGKTTIDLYDQNKLATYAGSTDKNDYYLNDDAVYVKTYAGQDKKTILLTQVGSVETDENDPEKAKYTNNLKVAEETPEFLASSYVSVTKRLFGDNDWESLGDVRVYDVFKNKANKIGLKFAGFTPDDTVYELNTTFTYHTTEEPENAQNKKLTNQFTFRTTSEAPHQGFEKLPPQVLKERMQTEVFNLIFRSDDDRERDAILERLFGGEVDASELSAAELAFKQEFEEEYKKFFHTDFDYTTFKDDLNSRMIEWRLRLSNVAGGRYPEDNSAVLVFEDSHMDNRLVYESLTFNLDRETYKNLTDRALQNGNQAQQKALDKIKNVAYLEDLASISLGVDFSENGGSFTTVQGYKLTDLYQRAVELFQEEIAALHDPQKADPDAEKADSRYVTKEFDKDNNPLNVQGINYSLILDQQLGQVIVKIRNFFIAPDKNAEGEIIKDANGNINYYSPIQQAYKNEPGRIKDALEELQTQINEGTLKPDQDPEEEFLNILAWDSENRKTCVKKTIPLGEDGKADITAAIDKYLDNADAYQAEIDNQLADLEKKGDTHASDNTNRLYNALRVVMKDGVSVADKRYPVHDALEVIVNSTLADNVDVPFTDAYGKLLTNEPTLLYNETLRQMADILNKVPADAEEYSKLRNKTCEQILQIAANPKHSNYQEAVALLILAQEQAEANLGETKPLATGSKLNDEDGHTYRSKDAAKDLYSPAAGKTLDAKDLAYVVTELKGGKLEVSEPKLIETLKHSFINPYYLDVNGTSLDDPKFKEDFPDYSPDNVLVNLSAYYNSQYGYNSKSFANVAWQYLYWNPTNEIWQTPGTKWSCPPGLYHCKEGTDSDSGEESNEPGRDQNIARSEFDITETVEESTPTPGKNQLSKNLNGSGYLDLSKENDTIGFTIDLRLDALTREQAITYLVQKYGSDKTSPEYQAGKQEIDAHYGPYNNQYATVAEDSLLVDILPNGLDTSGMDLKYTINSDVFYSNDANRLNEEKPGAKYAKFLAEIEVVRFQGSISSYKANLQDQLNAGEIDKAGYDRRIKRIDDFLEQYKNGTEENPGFGQDLENLEREYVFVWLPSFEAPHSDQPLVSLQLNGIKAAKDTNTGYRENRTNYSSDFWSGLSYKDFSITDQSGDFDKELRLWEEKRDENGNIVYKTDENGNRTPELVEVPINPDDPSNNPWFKGAAKVKFGQRFDYKITWRDSEPDKLVGGADIGQSSFDLTDELPQYDNLPEQFRPHMVGRVILSENANTPGITVIYKLKDDVLVEWDDANKQFVEIEVVDGKYQTVNEGRTYEDKPDFYSQIVGLKLSYSMEKNGMAKFNQSKGVSLVIPMQVPEFETTITDGKISLNGDEPDFDLAEFLKGNSPTATNQAEANTGSKSNKVITKLDELVLEANKQWFDPEGKLLSGDQIKDLSAKFTVRQIAIKVEVDENGNPVAKEYGQSGITEKYNGIVLTLNNSNNFKALVRDLPGQSSFIVYDKDGNVDQDQSYVIFYRYQLVEESQEGWEDQNLQIEIGEDNSVSISTETPAAVKDLKFTLDADGKLVIPDQDPTSPVQVVGNTSKPPTPGNPPETPKTPPENPPFTPPEEEEPPTPPSTPPTSKVKSFKETPPSFSKGFTNRLPGTSCAQSTLVPQAQARVALAAQRHAALALQASDGRY